VTIRDVARRAGVSTAVVSYVLNRTRPVSREKEERVLRAVEELAYVPNAVARSLKRKRTNLIGVIVPDLGNPFFAPMVRGAESVARASGYLIITCSAEEAGPQISYLQALHERRVEGFIILPSTGAGPHLLSLARRRVPLVMIEREIEAAGDIGVRPALDIVMIDNEVGVFLATSHLLALGHRRIGLVSIPLDSSSGVARARGYERAHREQGLTPDPALQRFPRPTMDGGYEGALELLDSGAQPSALIAGNSRQTVGVVNAIAARGLRIPDDISLVGYGHPDFFPMPTLPLTLVSQPAEEVGRLAAQLLIRRIEEEEPGTRQRIVLQPELQMGRSTLPPRVGAGRDARIPA